MKRAVVLLLLGLLIQSSLKFDEVYFSGKVIDKSTKKPLTGVQVIILSQDKKYDVWTNRYGQFKLKIDAGKYDIICIYFVNKDTTIKDVQIQSGINDEMMFEIEPNTNQFINTSDINLDEPTWELEHREPPDKMKSEELEEGATPLEPASMEGGTTRKFTKRTTSGEVETTDASSDLKVSRDLKASTIHSKPDGEAVGTGLSESADSYHGSSSFYGKKDEPAAAAGLLTSGEVNDFRKWELWQDISRNDFERYSSEWMIKPTDRFTVQLTTLDGKPAVDESVSLISGGKVIWSSRTDNTGKAELWANLFTDSSKNSDVIKEVNTSSYSVDYFVNGEIRKIENIKKFHDGINFAGTEEPCDLPEEVDILFTVDATGSMGDEIEYLKAELKDIISKIKEKKENLKLNLGSIFYRDIGDEFIVRKSELSRDIDKTVNFINEQTAGGGGDYPEAVEMALQTSLNEINWSKKAVARLLFLILDAPPHNQPEIKEKLGELIARAAIEGVRIIPVACSGVDKSTEYLMRALALATNGTYVFLTSHSGIGDSHIEPTTDKYDVELLNDLFIRLIDQFTIVPSCSAFEPVKGDEISDNIYNKDEIKINEKDENFKELTGRLRCFPNPTSGILNIELEREIEQLYLVDVTGKILNKIENLSEGKKVLDLSAYPTGIYYIKFLTEAKWGSHKILLIK